MNYTFSNVGNASNIYLENFKWIDYIPTDYVRIQKMTTGTWNQDLSYSVYYKTNKTNEYVLFRENLQTTKDHELDFEKVDVDFKECTSPTMKCKSFDILQDGEIFTNQTKTVGTYFGITAEAEDKWTTIVHRPKVEHPPILPRTGE